MWSIVGAATARSKVLIKLNVSEDRLQPVPMVDSLGNVTMGGAGHNMAAHGGHDIIDMNSAENLRL